MDFPSSYYSLLFLVVGLLSFFSSWFSFRQANIRERYLGGLLVFAGLWSILFGISLITPDVETKFNLAVIYYFCAQIIPILLFSFSIRLITEMTPAWVRFEKLLFLIPLVNFVISATNRFHNLIWTGYTQSPVGDNIIKFIHSQYYWFGILGIIYIVLFADVFLIAYAAFKPKPILPRSILCLIFASVVLPWLNNFFYQILRYQPMPGVDLTALIFVASGTMISFAMTENLIYDLNKKNTEHELAISRLRMEQNQRLYLEHDLALSHRLSIENLANHSRDLQAFYDLIIIGEVAKTEAEVIQQSIVKIKKIVNCDLILYYSLQNNGKLRLKSFSGTSAKSAIKTIDASEDWLPNVQELRIDQNLTGQLELPEFLNNGTFINGLFQWVVAGKQPKALIVALRSNARDFYTENTITLFSALVNGVGVILENEVIREHIIAEATNEERLRIARNMHDSIAQLLNGMLLTIDTILTTGKDTPSIKFSLIKMRDSLTQGIREMRLFLYESREQANEAVDFPTLITTRTKYVEAHSGMDVVLNLQKTKRYPHFWNTHLYMISNEALNNALLHSKARQVDINFFQKDDDFILEICDDGTGIEGGKILSAGYGMKNIEERCKLLKADLEIVSNIPQGTIIRVSIKGK